MKVWWCEEHKSGFEGQNAECDIRRLVAHKGLPITQCRVVEMLLVPADARIVNEAAWYEEGSEALPSSKWIGQ